MRALSRLSISGIAFLIAACAAPHPLPKFEPPLARNRVQSVRTTAYTDTEADHLPYGRHNALGTALNSGPVNSAAADWSRWPAGTLFRIQQTGEIYQVDDYGWALAGTNTMDLYKPSRAAMNEWGVHRVNIEILHWGDVWHSYRVLQPRDKYAHVRRMVKEIASRYRPGDNGSEPTVPTVPAPAAAYSIAASVQSPAPPPAVAVAVAVNLPRQKTASPSAAPPPPSPAGAANNPFFR